MCVWFLAYGVDADYPVILAGNRDEFLDRPTLAADFRPDAPEILAGRDEKEGGTWMGLSRRGRWAFLTNFRDPAAVRPERESRGHIVSGYLSGSEAPEAWLSHLSKTADDYNPFNLVAADASGAFFFSNHAPGISRIPPGVHGFSNSLPDVSWPKVARGRAALSQLLEKSPEGPDTSALFRILSDTRRAQDRELPETGVGLEFERVLSSIFVQSPVYGTRSSTVMLLSRDGRALFLERSFPACDPAVFTEVRFDFSMP